MVPITDVDIKVVKRFERCSVWFGREKNGANILSKDAEDVDARRAMIEVMPCLCGV